ncbi:hypothetical protein LTR70_009976 [Exophiala xenobiotica]|uniref:Inheritance of peroxisomes protein 1 n=1 Tax=Lithohypha guttulata TaxID=1690604 RepID=A0ABR0KL25_9EURO|nr:hypothetical protein LTR24_001552 [Lithohypha guttulata]KAK5309806.1 hypothetical protein LTR70_009976 [Exophiala xenobiotica]
MASSPIDGERPSRGGFRRSSSNFATIPQRSLSFHERAGLAQDDAAANILYSHPNVRIYKFQPPTDALKSLDKTQKTLPDADYPIDAIEVLPWRARTEMLSAKGRMIIEKVQGSVHFLKAGDLIHTIMKNSQCWCVDGESRFVMRVGKLKYQRIEFPNTDDNEKKKVDEFKEVISKILKFEKTPCPFTRAFHVDLPEDAITPRRRGTWKRRESLTPITPDVEAPVVRKAKGSRTVSMKAMPPNSFPSRPMSQLDTERPRTASTPISSARFSYPDIRTESPTIYMSGEETTDSDRHDSEPERPESSLHSEADESDRDVVNVPVIRSPLKYVETLPNTEVQEPTQDLTQPRQDSVLRQSGDITEVPDKTVQNIRLAADSTPSINDVNVPVVAEAAPAAPPTTTAEAITAQHGPIDTSSVANMDGQTEQNGIPIADTKVEDDESGVNDTVQGQLADGGLAPVSTEDASHINKREERVPRFNTEETLAVENRSILPSSAADVGSFLSTTKELTSPAPSSRAEDHLHLQWEDQKNARDSFPETKVSGIAQSGASVDISTEDLTRTRTDDDTESILSTDSYHTLLSDDSHIVAEDLSNTRPFQHRRELSEMTVTAASMNYDDDIDREEEAANGPTSISEESDPWPEQQAPGAFLSGPELRQRLSRRRSLSPLPPASILAPLNQNDQSSSIPKELLQKAATLAVGKPIEAMMFVVHVLARIARGATMNDLMSGDLFRRPGARRTAAGTFERDTGDQAAAQGSEDEDDFGFLRRKSSNKDTEQPGHVNDHNDDAASFASID